MAGTRAYIPWWKNKLSVLIAENFRSFAYIRDFRETRNRSESIFYVGKSRDIDTAQDIYEYAKMALDSLRNEFLERPAVKRRKRKDKALDEFTLGFLEGLKDQFEAQKKENEEMALMIMQSQRIEKNVEETEGLQPDYSGDKPKSIYISEANMEGYEKGRSFQPNVNKRNQGKVK